MVFDRLDILHATVGLVECIDKLPDLCESLTEWRRGMRVRGVLRQTSRRAAAGLQVVINTLSKISTISTNMVNRRRREGGGGVRGVKTDRQQRGDYWDLETNQL
jgi:hypothetical protein